MRRVLLLSAVIIMCASLAFAQGGSVGIFADPSGTNCNLSDIVPGLCTYYVVHLFTPGATAVQFSAPQPSCMLAVFLSDTAVFPVTIGSSQTGVSIGYGVCLASPINVLMTNYFCQGLTAPCCPYPVLPDPAVASGQIEVVNCAGQLLTATGQTAVINANATCQCAIVPTEETSWGKVKALFE